MNLFIRAFLVLICSFFKKRTDDPLQTFKLRMHVWPTDLDTNMHMNNGRYLTLMDLGRMDMVIRNGLMAEMFKIGAIPVLSAAQVRYRIPLFHLQSYDMETRVVCWDEKWVYMEQKFVIAKGKKAGAIAAIAILKGSFFSPKKRETVPSSELIRLIGFEGASPEFPDYILKWRDAEESLRTVTSGD